MRSTAIHCRAEKFQRCVRMSAPAWQVNHIQDDFHWRSTIAFGAFEEITNEAERRSILRDLLVRFPKLTPVESQLARDAEPPPIIVFRLRIDRISGVAED